MAVPKIPRLSVEYLLVPITSTLPAANLDDLVVKMAVVDDGEQPVTADWQTAEWIGTSIAALIGPGTDIDLGPGTYDVWVKITASPEEPVLESGSIHIT